MAEEPGGSLWIGGRFDRVNTWQRAGLVKLGADGVPDFGFSYSLNPVEAVVLQPDGKILVGGSFVSISRDGFGSQTKLRLARFNANGSLDTGFSSSANGSVLAIALQADGKIITGGYFDTMNGISRGRVARLFPDGSLDTGFDPGADREVFNVIQYPEGRILIAGNFSKISDLPANSVALLCNDPAGENLEITSDGELRWNRSGSLPEVSSAGFESSTDSGVNWSPLGSGTRIAEGWSLPGTALPPSGHVRVLGRHAVSSRGFGLSGSHLLYGRSPTPLESWRETRFASPFNSGKAANASDPDGDGLANIIEYAFGLLPLDSTSHQLPGWIVENGDHVLRFLKPTETDGATISAEWSSTLQSTDWHPAEDNSSGDMIEFRVPTSADPSKFFRLKVTAD